ncbi:unnamed protein product [Sphagnum balticum]
MWACKIIVKECCCNDKWLGSAIRQAGDLRETFRGIVYDLQWCRSILCMILPEQLGEDNSVFKPANCDGKLSVSDHHALFTAFQDDQENLKGLLKELKELKVDSLATQLLKKLDFQTQPARIRYYRGLYNGGRRKLSEQLLVLLVNKRDLRRGNQLGREGMKYLHSLGFAHNDLKLDNILMKSLVAETYAAESSKSKPPERSQLMKTGVYSFGNICSQLLTGRSCPFDHSLLYDDTKEFKNAVRHHNRRPELPQVCPICLSALIQRCWHGYPLM